MCTLGFHCGKHMSQLVPSCSSGTLEPIMAGIYYIFNIIIFNYLTAHCIVRNGQVHQMGLFELR